MKTIKCLCFYTIEHGNKKGLKAGEIYAYKMKSPVEVEGEPVQILHNHIWQEGPILQKKDAVYYLTYSCGNWMDSTYHLRYALSDNILGPYTEKPDTILKTNDLVKGPGHHFLFKDKDGNDWVVYHGWDVDFTARYPRIDRFYVDEENQRVFSNGPTFTPQPIQNL
ncbi:MAG: family 43 glycosylhydrolase [Bacteroidales bacterium]|nr:family 43 glycosylhydrolase [Bacteroidales bacterium]